MVAHLSVLVVAFALLAPGAAAADDDAAQATDDQSLSRSTSLSNEPYAQWRRAYDSLFVASLSKPYEAAITNKSADELLRDLRSLLGGVDSQVSSEERAEVKFWLEISIKDRFDLLVYCRRGFEQKIERRRAQLVSSTTRLRFYKPNTVVPDDIKLDEYIGERRRAIFDDCATSYGSYLAKQYAHLEPNVRAYLSRIERLGSALEEEAQQQQQKEESEEHLVGRCDERCKVERLAKAVAELIAPSCKTNKFLDLFCGLGLNRKQFDETYDANLLEPCNSVRQSESRHGNAFDLFLRYADEYWFERSSGVVRQWLRVRRVCEHIRDDSFASRAFALVARAKREQ